MHAKQSTADQIAGHSARNRELVQLIVKKGGDLTALRTIDLHFWAPDEASARELADALRKFGAGKITSRPSAASPEVWSVAAEYGASVNDVVADKFVEHLVGLAVAHGSEFDGWGTSL